MIRTRIAPCTTPPCVRATRSAWIGDCKDGRGDGPGIASFFNNGAEFESFTGNFSGGVAADGHVTVRWGEGWSYEGEMVGGHFEGQGTLVNDKKDRFEGQWKDGKLNGMGSVVHENGERYDGAWKDDLPNGHGILTRADGSKLEGEFLDGKYSGPSLPVSTPAMAAAADPGAAATPVSLDSNGRQRTGQAFRPAQRAGSRSADGSSTGASASRPHGQEAAGGGRRGAQSHRHRGRHRARHHRLQWRLGKNHLHLHQ